MEFLMRMSGNSEKILLNFNKEWTVPWNVYCTEIFFLKTALAIGWDSVGLLGTGTYSSFECPLYNSEEFHTVNGVVFEDAVIEDVIN